MRERLQRVITSAVQLVVLLSLAVGLLALVKNKRDGGSKAHTSTKVARMVQARVATDALPRVPVETHRSINAQPRVMHHDRTKAYQGVNLIPVTGAEEVLLMDMEGEILHHWPFDVYRARLLPNCHLMVVHGSVWGKDRDPWIGLRNRLREYDWEGSPVWEVSTPEEIHHDFDRLDNGNTVFLMQDTFDVSAGSVVAGKTLKKTKSVRSDAIVEITPKGKVAWNWFARDALKLASCGWRDCTRFPEPRQHRKKVIDWTHMNTVSVIPPNRWYSQGDLRFRPGNLMIVPRNFWSIFIVDRDSGEVVWTYEGNHDNGARYQEGLIRGHEAHMIREGLPGAGNILVFDNGYPGYRDFSIIREIEPVSEKTVWEYRDPDRLFSQSASALQRLPNGNTLISQDRGNPRVFEVNTKGEIVWEVQFSGEPSRAQRFPLDHCPEISELVAGKR